MSKKPQKISDKSKRFARKPPSRPPMPTVLVVVEGYSEEIYFNALKKQWRQHSAFVVHNPDCTDPVSLLNVGIAHLENSIQSKSTLVPPYDSVWIVYDLEKPNAEDRRKGSQKAQIQAKDNSKIHFAMSDPSFEFWYILHYTKTTKSFTGAEEAVKFLQEYWKNYDKNSEPLNDILEKTETAIGNAGWVRQQNKKNRSIAPMTDIDKIVKELKK